MANLHDARTELLRGKMLFVELQARRLDIRSPEYQQEVGKVMAVLEKALTTLNSYVRHFDVILGGELSQTAKEYLTDARITLQNIIDHVVIDFTRSMDPDVLSTAAGQIEHVQASWQKARAELISAIQTLQPAQQAALKQAA
jgi:hypothetical protein